MGHWTYRWIQSNLFPKRLQYFFFDFFKKKAGESKHPTPPSAAICAKVLRKVRVLKNLSVKVNLVPERFASRLQQQKKPQGDKWLRLK